MPVFLFQSLSLDFGASNEFLSISDICWNSVSRNFSLKPELMILLTVAYC